MDSDRIAFRLPRSIIEIMIRKNATSILLGIASLLAGPVSVALAAKAKAPQLEGSMPLLAMACTAVAVAGVCVVAFKKPSRAKGE